MDKAVYPERLKIAKHLNREDVSEMRNISSSMKQTPDWYRTYGDDHESPVTNLPTNREIGIHDIRLAEPTDEQFKEGMVCVAVLVTIMGYIDVAIYQSRLDPSCLTLMNPHYVDITPWAAAQVLRYVETQTDVIEPEA